MYPLILCDSLDKNLVFLTPIAKDEKINNKFIKNHIIAVEIDKDKFYNQLISPDGVAHKCLTQTKNE